MTTIKLNNKEVSLEAIKAILTEEQIKELTREEESGVFVPKLGEEFYLATGCMDVKENFYNNNNMDLVIDNFLVYRTEAEARKAQKRNQARIRVIRKIAELNASVGWKVDWRDREQYKYFLYFSHAEEIIKSESFSRELQVENYFYFSSEVKHKVLEACAEDYKIMLGIE